MSQVAKYVDPKMLNVDNLGYASELTVLFQRVSVIVTEFVFFYAVVSIFADVKDSRTRSILTALVFLSPGLLFVDSIHFQYNGFLYGIQLLSINAMWREQYLLGGVLFAVTMNFKHIYLYQAPAYFIFLLSRFCFVEAKGSYSFSISRFIQIGVSVVAVFLVSFGPFIQHIPQVVSRLFPFKRGLCHAYWAPNFWALYSFVDRVAIQGLKVAGKGSDIGDVNSLTRGLVGNSSFAVLPNIEPLHTLALTVVFQLPSLISLWKKPTKSAFVDSLVLCGFSSFLFGWHVHEKAILLVLIPLSIVASRTRRHAQVFYVLSCAGYLSLFPLIFKETVLFCWIAWPRLFVEMAATDDVPVHYFEANGVPVFTPSLEQFLDFPSFVARIEPIAAVKGLAKVVPPKEWTAQFSPHLALTAQPNERLKHQLEAVVIRSPIEQNFNRGTLPSGSMRQFNVETRKVLGVQDWFDLSNEETRRPPKPSVHSPLRQLPTASATPNKKKQRIRSNPALPPEMTPVTATVSALDNLHVTLGDSSDNDVDTTSPLPSVSNAHIPLYPAEFCASIHLGNERHPDSDSYACFNKDNFSATIPLGESISSSASSPPPLPPLTLNSLAVGGLVGSVPSPDPSSACSPTDSSAVRELSASLDDHDLDDIGDEEHIVALDGNINTQANKRRRPKKEIKREITFDLSSLGQDFTLDHVKELEKIYWKNLTYHPPLYGADMLGSLFEDTKENTWNPKNFDNLLNRINQKLPGVNNPYLYFGMWKATFAWHLEDMDLFSINYIHFGAPKQWYVIPPAYRQKFEAFASGIFADEARTCSQYLRHKSCVISPTALLAQGIKVEKVVQFEGEFVITFPYGYHAGYNLGFNCAESVNFAIDSWIEVGKKALYCTCVGDSVKLDVPHLFEGKPPSLFIKPSGPKKMAAAVSIAKYDYRQCALCPGTKKEGLLATDVFGKFAHKQCGQYVPETRIEKVVQADGKTEAEIVAGLDLIPKDRWSLKCQFCKGPAGKGKKPVYKAVGASIQCYKGKCVRTYHVSCAFDNGIYMTDDFMCYCPQHAKPFLVAIEPPPPLPVADAALDMVHEEDVDVMDGVVEDGGNSCTVV
ncbi:UNVERIFIED_CONTAM: hypothetical protein HDU68_010798 [Siphonaria sp. JEL0065]|nr:hypothetical protein HDU68_010798 [Siphonaria sp. JEL0065]